MSDGGRARRAERLVFPLVGALFVLTIYPVCALLFSCGCRWPWAGAATRCNIHNAAPPHCPLCSIGDAGFALFCGAALGLGWLVLSWSRRRFGRRLPPSLAAALLGVSVATLALALALAAATGYPTLLGISLSPSR